MLGGGGNYATELPLGSYSHRYLAMAMNVQRWTVGQFSPYVHLFICKPYTYVYLSSYNGRNRQTDHFNTDQSTGLSRQITASSTTRDELERAPTECKPLQRPTV